MNNPKSLFEKTTLLTIDQTNYEEINWDLVNHVRGLSVAEKNAWAFAAADFALSQKRLILAQQNPTWSEKKVDQEARRLVFGVSIQELS